MHLLEDAREKKLQILFWLVFGLFFSIKFFESLCFINYYDPFAYHLALPQIWYQTSFAEAMRDNDLFLIAGIFDYFYLIPMYLSRGNSFVAQLMAQNMHFLFSLGLGSLFLTYYFKKEIWAPLAGLCLLTISKSATFFMVAKNDGALSLAVLVTFVLIFDSSLLKNLTGLKRAFVIGIFLGMIPAIKLNGLVYAFPLGLLYIVIHRKSYRSLLIVILTSCFLVGLVFFKNWFFIKNPVFPAFSSKIPGESSAQMIQFYSHYMNSKFVISDLLLHFKHFFLGKGIYLFSLPIVLFSFGKFLKTRQLFSLDSGHIVFLTSLISYILYALVNGGLPTYRFIFPGYFLLTFFLFKYWQQNSVIFAKYQFFPLLILLVIVADSKIDKSVSRIIHAFQQRNLTQKEIVRQEFHYSHFWDYIDGVSEGKKIYIISDYLSNMYYAPKGVRVQCSLLDRHAGIVQSCPDVNLLKKYDYALIKEKGSNACYQKILSQGKLLHQVEDIALYKL